MAKNLSTDKKTLKESLGAFDSDIWCPDRYLLYCNYLDKVILPDGNILDDYYDYFQQFLEEINVPEEYFYKPAAFSEMYYGTPDLDFLIMYFAQIPTLLEFNRKKIKILPLTRLSELNQLATTHKKKVEESYSNPIKYTAIAEISEYKKNYL